MTAGLLREQAAAVRRGTVDPEALLQSTLDRLEGPGRTLNAIAATFPQHAREMLRTAPAGPLHGVPIVVKDMFALPWRAPLDGATAPVSSTGAGASATFRALQASGAVVVAAGAMHQLGLGTTGHISATGPARNPWDLERCAGGSSGGSAASVAAGLVSGSIGSDAAGSIRIPAAYCGVTGLKPTWGQVSVDGYSGSYSSFAVVGPIARDAEDCRLLHSVLTGTALTADPARSVRIGILPAQWDDLAPGVEARCTEALGILAEGGNVARHALAGEELVAAATVIANAIERLPRLTPDTLAQIGPALHPTILAILKGHLMLPANAAARATRARMVLRRELLCVFDSVDVLAAPTVPSTAPTVDRPRVELPSGPIAPDLANLRLSGLANLTGIPAISVPCGLAGGLPVGLTLAAAWGREDLLLDGAQRFEALTGRAFVDATPRG